MFAFGAAFVSGAWRNSKNLKIVRAREVEIIVPSKRPLIVLDGEPVRVSRVGTVTLERRALPVLAMPLDQQDSATAPGAGK
jgi:diacylglycerol kinase family enzyme